MQYIAYAQRGEFDKCAEESFDCVMCGVCSSRCPAGISHPQVAMLARRLNGKYLAPKCEAPRTSACRRSRTARLNELIEAPHGKAARRAQGALQPPRDREIRRTTRYVSDQSMLKHPSEALKRHESENVKLEPSRMTADEKDALLRRPIIPTTGQSEFAELELRPEQGRKGSARAWRAARGAQSASRPTTSTSTKPDIRR